MSLVQDNLPYSKKRLEDLAAALGVNSAYLWVNPVTNTFSVKSLSQAPNVSLAVANKAEDEEDEESGQ